MTYEAQDSLSIEAESSRTNIEVHPKRLQPISVDLLKRINVLTDGVEYDIDAALPDDDEEHE